MTTTIREEKIRVEVVSHIKVPTHICSTNSSNEQNKHICHLQYIAPSGSKLDVNEEVNYHKANRRRVKSSEIPQSPKNIFTPSPQVLRDLKAFVS